MKRWALILAVALFMVNQGILLVASVWPARTLASVLPLAMALRYFKRTDQAKGLRLPRIYLVIERRPAVAG